MQSANNLLKVTATVQLFKNVRKTLVHPAGLAHCCREQVFASSRQVHPEVADRSCQSKSFLRFCYRFCYRSCTKQSNACPKELSKFNVPHSVFRDCFLGSLSRAITSLKFLIFGFLAALINWIFDNGSLSSTRPSTDIKLGFILNRHWFKTI